MLLADLRHQLFSRLLAEIPILSSVLQFLFLSPQAQSSPRIQCKAVNWCEFSISDSILFVSEHNSTMILR